MRKYLSVLAVLALALGCVGCSNWEFGTNVHQNSRYRSPMDELTDPSGPPNFWGVTGTN